MTETPTLFIPKSIASTPKITDPERDALYPAMIATSVAIEKDDLPKLTHLLGITPLASISQAFFDDLLEEYLSRCERIIREKQLDRIEAGKIIFEHFAQEYNRRVENDETNEAPDVPLRIYMLMSLTFSDETLRLLRKLCPDDTFEEQMHDLINADEVPMTAYAVRRLLEQYPDKSLETYMDLYMYAEEKQNDTLIDYLGDKVKELAPPCKKPPYMRTFDEKLALPDGCEDDCDHHASEMATLLVERLGTFGIEVRGNVENAQKYITSILLASPSQRHVLLQAITNPRQEEKLDENRSLPGRLDEKETAEMIFRLLGPLNAFPTKLPGPPDCICMYYGGCRMFGCCEFEIEEDEDGDGELTGDWYTGNCEYCFLKIPNRFWSVRRPLSSGGWKGCYCSWACVREEITDLNLPDGASMIALTETMEADMYEIGIADQ